MKLEQASIYGRAAQFFNEAMKLSPSEMYDAIGSPKPSRVASAVAGYTASRLPEIDEDGKAKCLLYQGINDVENALNFDLKLLPLAEAREYILHPNTIQTMGRLARLRNEEGDDQIHAALEQLYTEQARAYQTSGYTPARHLPFPREYIVPSQQESRGCPAAMQGGSEEHAPIFDRAVIWAGLLSRYALAYHRIPEQYSLDGIDPAELEHLFAMPN